jgi:hypothetical protein
MSAFEFSFTFYGLVLGLSVVELVAGVGRLVHEGHRIRVGWLTPALAAFLALDVATFWNQSWVMNQHAPYSLSLLILGLTSAGLFYIAATLVFPRDIEDGEDLTVHYWRHRRLALSLVAAANLLNIGVFTVLAHATEPSLLWENLAFIVGFTTVMLGAALLPRGRLAVACLILLLAYDLMMVVFDVVILVQTGAWELGNARPGAGGVQ